MLQALVGAWSGEMRTWFEPDVLADTAAIEGSIRSVADGLFVVHEYASELQGKAISGVAILGHDEGEGRWETVWVDSFHTGSSMLISRGTESMDVLGHYSDGQGGPEWGWRTVTALDGDSLTITHFNVSPSGEEVRAVQVDYRRA